MSDNTKIALVLAVVFGVILLLGLFASPDNSNFAKVIGQYKQHGKTEQVSPSQLGKSFK